eukprot:IDg23873t1
MAPKAKRTRLSIQEKLEIADAIKAGQDYASLQKKYNVGRRTVTRIKIEAPTIRKKAKENALSSNLKSSATALPRDRQNSALFCQLLPEVKKPVTLASLSARAIIVRDRLVAKLPLKRKDSACNFSQHLKNGALRSPNDMHCDGTDKVPFSIIGKSRTPRCFRNGAPAIRYFSQKNAWCDAVVFRSWFNDLFLTHIRKKTSLPVALLMDNCGAHGSDVAEGGNKLQFFLFRQTALPFINLWTWA